MHIAVVCPEISQDVAFVAVERPWGIFRIQELRRYCQASRPVRSIPPTEDACSLTIEVPLSGERERGRSLGCFRSEEWRRCGKRDRQACDLPCSPSQPLGAGRLRRLGQPEVRRVSDSRTGAYTTPSCRISSAVPSSGALAKTSCSLSHLELWWGRSPRVLIAKNPPHNTQAEPLLFMRRDLSYRH